MVYEQIFMTDNERKKLELNIQEIAKDVNNAYAMLSKNINNGQFYKAMAYAHQITHKMINGAEKTILFIINDYENSNHRDLLEILGFEVTHVDSSISDWLSYDKLPDILILADEEYKYFIKTFAIEDAYNLDDLDAVYESFLKFGIKWALYNGNSDGASKIASVLKLAKFKSANKKQFGGINEAIPSYLAKSDTRLEIEVTLTKDSNKLVNKIIDEMIEKRNRGDKNESN